MKPMKQLSLFPCQIRSAYLSADSSKKAFYELSLVENEGYFFVVKRSGIATDKVLDQRQWGFSDYAKAEKEFKNRLKQKINPRRNSSRIYNIIDYLW